MIPTTTNRVSAATSEALNQRIAREMEGRVAHFAAHPEGIPRRLHELDGEWDIERTLEANAATLAFMGVALGALVDKRWLILPAAVTAFLLQHAVQGWCPPLPVLRQLGFRTASEIDEERQALKAMRGDFERVARAPDKAAAALRAVRA